jgi:hypothetical protein
MKTIPLTRGLVAIVDDEDYERLCEFKWHANSEGYAVRAVRNEERKQIRIRMHRLVLGIPIDDPREVDHINGNRSDNRKGNLRICQRFENQANRKAQRNNSSGFKGVYWVKRSKKWTAQITSNGKSHSLGYFYTAEAAHWAYKKAADELHGNFANHGTVLALQQSAHELFSRMIDAEE